VSVQVSRHDRPDRATNVAIVVDEEAAVVVQPHQVRCLIVNLGRALAFAEAAEQLHRDLAAFEGRPA
jgi:hypothetical protein